MLKLSELQFKIKEAVKLSLEQSYWIVAEISELNINQTGHCYLELIERDEEADRIIAKGKAIIWSSTFKIIDPYFYASTGEKIKVGFKVLIKVSVEYSELYGLSFSIKDIDPVYTIGEQKKKRNEIIQQLESEGVLDMNKELLLPEPVQKIAIISSETAAGYQDFICQLKNNPYGFKFYTKLFPSLMQGESSSESIISALEKINDNHDKFDLIAIIRGGGSKSELSCFDNYRLAYYITQCNLPVLSGIGHERDQSIVDLTAHTSLKTPTATAEFIIQLMLENYEALSDKVSVFVESVDNKLRLHKELLIDKKRLILNSIQDYKNSEEKLQVKLINEFTNTFKIRKKEEIFNLQHLKENCRTLVKSVISNRINELKVQKPLLSFKVKSKLNEMTNRLNLLSEKSNSSNPAEVLKKGYTLVTKNKKIVRNSAELKSEDEIENIFWDGKIQSKVLKKQ